MLQITRPGWTLASSSALTQNPLKRSQETEMVRANSMGGFESPLALVRGLRQGSVEARQALRALCETLIMLLLQAHAKRYPSSPEPAAFVNTVFAWLVIHLQKVPDRVFEAIGASEDPWGTFRKYVLSSTWRLLLWEPKEFHPTTSPGSLSGGTSIFVGDETSLSEASAPELSEWSTSNCVGFGLRAHFQPLSDVGGDWFYAAVPVDGTVWTLLADAPGKVWPTYVLKRAVGLLWEGAIGGQIGSPDDLLEQLHARLTGILPDGFCIEVTTATHDAQGRVQFSTAGVGTIVTHQRKSNSVRFLRVSHRPVLGADEDLVKLLMAEYEKTRDQVPVCWDLDSGDEFMIASDGLADQPVKGESFAGQAETILNDRRWKDASLHDRVVSTLKTEIEQSSQLDDITLLSVSRVGSDGS